MGQTEGWEGQETPCNYGELPLHFACCTNQIPVVEYLIRKGAARVAPSEAFALFRTRITTWHADHVETGPYSVPGLPYIVCSLSQEIEAEDSHGNNCLHLCVIHNLPQMYDMIVKHWNEVVTPARRRIRLEVHAAAVLMQFWRDKKSPSSPTTLSICAALALLTPLLNPGSRYRGGGGT